MLQVISLRGGRSADYYVGLADDQVQRDGRDRLARGPSDYYVDTGEPPGRWWGAQADAWGLTAGDGLVAGSDLRLLLDGKHPTTGAQLGRAYSEGGPRPSVRGFDATFSMPKSVSVLWAITTLPEVRAVIEAAGWAAVTATLAHLERVGAVTRIGPAGAQVQVDTGGLAAAIFEQHTNRSAEPQLHWHAVIAAKVDAGDGRWRALDAQFLKQHQSSLGYVFQAAVRSELTARLGVSWGPTVKGSADLTGMDRSVIDAFARRSREVETAYGRLLAQWQDTTGRDEPNRLERHALRHAAARASRGPKEPGYHPVDLHTGWQAELRLAGIEATDLEHEVLRRRVLPVRDLSHQTYEVALPALEDVAAERGQWHHAEMMKALAARVTPRAATAADVVTILETVATETLEAHALVIAPEPAAGLPRRADGRPLVERVVDCTWTTPQLWEAEERLGSWALVAELMGGRRELTLASAHGLDPAQLEAFAEVAGTRPLVVLVGPAGTGKTRLLEAARAQLDADFRPVIGLAVTAATALRLEDDTGLVCDTVAKLLYSADQPYRPGALPPLGTTVVIDEATQVTTQQWARLVDLAEAHDWRLVAVGDPAQIGAVGPGGIFASWVDQYRWTVQLDQVHRFTAEWERDASLRLRVGDTDALFDYADHDRIHRTTPATLTDDVIAHWDRHCRDHGEVLWR